MESRTSAPSWGAVGCALALAALLAAWAFWLVPPTAVRYREEPLQGPFERIGEVIYQADVPASWPHDNKGADRNSRLQLVEDGAPLGPPHAGVGDMEARPGGFAHLRFGLWFTTSDHSDPNTNGRRYRLRHPRSPSKLLHLAVVLALHFLVSFAAWGVIRRGWPWGGRGRGIVQAAAQGLVLLGTVQLAAWSLLESELTTAGKVEEELYRGAFAGESPKGLLEYSYEPHHYLVYALNGRKLRGVEALHQGLYRLRRSQPLLSREEVDLRILALGGSTTYDVALRDEADTWVYRLEARLRQAHGEGVEVLNAGAGGYTLLENSIHYLTLLNHLDPDVVLLFTGHNDVHPRFFGTLAPDYSNYRVPWAGQDGEMPRPAPALAGFYPYRLAYLQMRLRPALSRSVGDVSQKPGGGRKKWAQGLARNGSEVYHRALDSLVLLLRAQGREVVLLPQYLTPRSPGDEIFGRGVAEHNEVGRQVAGARGALFVEALMAPGVFDPADTVDRCHFSDRGADKMAGLVARALEEAGVLQRVFSRRSGTRPEPGPGTPR